MRVRVLVPSNCQFSRHRLRTKQITDGLDGDTPQIGKLLGAEVFVLHQVGLLHTFDRCRGRDWLPLDEFLGSTKQGYQVVWSWCAAWEQYTKPATRTLHELSDYA